MDETNSHLNPKISEKNENENETETEIDDSELNSSKSMQTLFKSQSAALERENHPKVTRSVTTSEINNKQISMVDQLNKKLQLSLKNLSVSSDIPRLAPRTNIFNPSNEIIFKSLETRDEIEKSIKNIKLSKQFILVLASSINMPTKEKLVSLINEKYQLINSFLCLTFFRFYEYVPLEYQGDIKDRFSKFLSEIIEPYNEISSILKCCNQAIVAPSIISLKMGLIGKINYKDHKNFWDLQIKFLETGGVIIIHTKVCLHIID